MTDNVVVFPGADAPTTNTEEARVTPESIMEAAQDRYEELIMIGRTKGTSRYECVSTIDIPDTLYHITRIQHRLNLYLDGQ